MVVVTRRPGGEEDDKEAENCSYWERHAGQSYWLLWKTRVPMVQRPNVGDYILPTPIISIILSSRFLPRSLLQGLLRCMPRVDVSPTSASAGLA